MSDNGKSTTFLPLKKLVQDFLLLSHEEFLAKYDDPVLVVNDVGGGSESAQFQTIDTSKRPSDTADDLLEKLDMGSRWVVPLQTDKRKFASMVTVGRASTNNVRINVGSLSKFHAFFTFVRREQAWYISDANSSNGTFINGEELPTSHGKTRLQSGMFIRFGPDVIAKFYEPAPLYEMLRASGGSPTGAGGAAQG